MKAVLGIDPGSEGAACFINENHDEIVVIRFEKLTIQQTASAILTSPYSITSAGIENVHSMRRDKVNKAFAFGRNRGKIEGICACALISLEEIDSGVWLRHFSLYGLVSKFIAAGMKESAAKSEAKRQYQARATEIFGFEPTLDMTDAMLIAEFVWRKTYGKIIPFDLRIASVTVLPGIRKPTK